MRMVATNQYLESVRDAYRKSQLYAQINGIVPSAPGGESNAAGRELPAVTSARPARREQETFGAETPTGRPGGDSQVSPAAQSGDSAQQPTLAAPALGIALDDLEHHFADQANP